MYAGHNQNWYAYHLYRYYHFFTAFSFGGADARRANDRCSPGQFSNARSQSINARTQVQSTRDVWTCCGGHGHPQKEPSKGETMPKLKRSKGLPAVAANGCPGYTDEGDAPQGVARGPSP